MPPVGSPRVFNRIHRVGVLALVLTALSCIDLSAAAPNYYAGQWDSTLYNLSDHPHTIAIRILVEDVDTSLPLAGAAVTISGEYEDSDGFGGRATREFELRATTGADGIAVFGLLWHDRSQVDDIEKVRLLNVRRDGYRFVERPLTFNRLIRTSAQYEKDGWKAIIRETPGARYFLPLIGVHFRDWNNLHCSQSEFFHLVRNEEYGEVFRAKDDNGHDFPSHFFTSNPQREAGPFMMVPIVLRMQRVFNEQHVIIHEDDPRERNDKMEAPVAP